MALKECYGCTYTTTLTKYEKNGTYDPVEYVWLCGLCAGTHIGNIVTSVHPTTDQIDKKMTYATICYVGNTLLTAITGLRNRNK
jgi:hypothetical protein